MAKVKVTGNSKSFRSFELPYKFGMNFSPDKFGEQDKGVKKTLSQIPWDEAKLEAEKGEVKVGGGTDGLTELYEIPGKRHSEGGTPMTDVITWDKNGKPIFPNMKANDYIFSDTKSMQIKDPFVLKQFGENNNKTPADIAKKYDLNAYKKLYTDKHSDALTISTNEKNIQNANNKLGQLALYAESQKGFPEGIPFIAMPYLMVSGANPEDFHQQTSVQGMPETGMARYGRNIPMAQSGKNYEPPPNEWKQKELGKVTPQYKAKTQAGKVTQTGRNTESIWNDQDWENKLKDLGVDLSGKTHAQMQREAYKNADPYSVAYMWGVYGNTNAGEKAIGQKDIHSQFAPLKDEKGNVIENQSAYKKRMMQTYKTPEDMRKAVNPYEDYMADNIFGKRLAILEKNIPIDEQQKPNIEQPLPEKTAGKIPVPDVNIKSAPIPPAEYWKQDIINTMGAVKDKYSIKKYMPWQAKPDVYLPNPTFYDPTRELAANAEQANIGTMGAATFAGPQQFNSRFSRIQGQGAQNVANTLAKYNNMNVGVANQFENNRAGIMNQYENNLAHLDTQLYDKNTIVNQQYDNAMRLANNQVRNQYTNAITNKYKTDSMNQIYGKNFRINPGVGGAMNFYKASNIQPNYQDPEAQAKEFNSAMEILKASGVAPTTNDVVNYLKYSKGLATNTTPMGGVSPELVQAIMGMYGG